MEFTYRYVNQVNEAGVPIDRFVMVPKADIDANGWQCCSGLDTSEQAGEVAADDTALVPARHFFVHELVSLPNQHLADIVGSSTIQAGEQGRSGAPRYRDLDLRLATRRQLLARQELLNRGFTKEQVQAIGAGEFWPQNE